MSGRIDEARSVARALLDELEAGAQPIDAVLMKAKRLARLMRDADAQSWLDLEMRGYPTPFDFSELGTCGKYAVTAGRLNNETLAYYPQSLPTLEATALTDEALLNSLRP